MTRDDIIKMAREAYGDWYPNAVPHELERFAALVAAAEREACAKVCDDLALLDRYENAWTAGWSEGTDGCAAAIRARGEA